MKRGIKVVIKLMGKTNTNRVEGSCAEGGWGLAKTVSVQSLCRSLCLLDSARYLIAVRGQSKDIKGGLRKRSFLKEK